jgi:hypothetical protein
MENTDLQNNFNYGVYDLLNFSALISVKRGNDWFLSSAVIIGDEYLLTTAHSVEDICAGRV